MRATRTPIYIADLKIETVAWGNISGDAPAIVFLHDGLGSAGLWRDFPEKLAKAAGLPAFAFSRLGYGESTPCPLPRSVDYMGREASDFLPAVLTAARIRRYVLFGHSDGGSIALLHAIAPTRPGLLGVVTEAAHVFCEEVTLKSIRLAKEDFDRGNLRERLAKHHGANVDCAFPGWSSMWLNPAFASFDFRRELHTIRCPVLALQGVDDEYGTSAQIEAIRTVPHSETHLLPDCGHTPHREQAAMTLELAGRFIAGLLSGKLKATDTSSAVGGG